QFGLKAYEGAKATWEAVRTTAADDIEANLLLGTVYEKLEDRTRSEQAIERVLHRDELGRQQRAEAYALKARNAKADWRAQWFDGSPEQARPKALRSAALMGCADAYERAFAQDLNHFYPGLNAAGMLTVAVELAQALPEVWGEPFDTPEEARAALERLRARR